MISTAFFQKSMDLLDGIVHAAVIHTDDLIFFKMFFHGATDRIQEITDVRTIVVQIQHAGYKIFLFIQDCGSLHNVSPISIIIYNHSEWLS